MSLVHNDPQRSFPDAPVRPLTEAQAKARRSRNLAIGLSVGGLCLLFYLITIAKYVSALKPGAAGLL
jgi:hypothetical protein